MKKILLHLTSIMLLASSSLNVSACGYSSLYNIQTSNSKINLNNSNANLTIGKTTKSTIKVINYSELSNWIFKPQNKSIVSSATIDEQGNISITAGNKAGKTTISCFANNKYNHQLTTTITVTNKYDINLNINTSNTPIKMYSNSINTQLIINNYSDFVNTKLVFNANDPNNINASYAATTGQITITSHKAGSYQIAVNSKNSYGTLINIIVNKSSIKINNTDIQNAETPLILNTDTENKNLKILNFNELTEVKDSLTLKCSDDNNIIKKYKIDKNDGSIDITTGDNASKAPIKFTIESDDAISTTFYVSVILSSKLINLSSYNSTVLVDGKSQTVQINEIDLKDIRVTSDSYSIGAQYNKKK